MLCRWEVPSLGVDMVGKEEAAALGEEVIQGLDQAI
jgi:hypothetical protein